MTTFMGLTLPTVLDPVGSPAWAATINANFNLLDAHDHTTNKGAKVPIAGLNINADIDLSSLYKIKKAYDVTLLSHAAAVTTDTGSVQNIAGEFTWINNAGVAVQITSGAGLNLASLGTIGGDYGGANPASVYYTNATKIFAFTQQAGITAHIAAGDLYIYESIASGKYVHLKPKAALAANLDLQLPSALPTDTSFLTCTSAGIIEPSVSVGSLPPIGTIIPFYDYNGALTFDSNYWAYCNGQTIAVGSLGAQVLPDLSNRYLVGFGTEAGGDIGSAAWETTEVGQASHQIDLSAVGASHNHQTGYIKVNTNDWYSYKSDGINIQSSAMTIRGNYAGSSAGGIVDNSYYGGNQNTYTKLAGTGGSATQTIQPRSIKVRFIMRIK